MKLGNVMKQIIFAWSICGLPDASANIRTVRSSNHSSRFIHHEEEKVPATTEPPENDVCIEDTVHASTETIEETTTDGLRKRRGHDYVTTISLTNGDNFMKDIRSDRRRRNDENGMRTNDYRKKISDDLSDRIKVDRVVRRKHNEIVTGASSDDHSEFIEDIRADGLKGKRQNSGIDMDTDMYSDEFLHCNHKTIEKAGYEKLPNGSVYVPEYEVLYGQRDYHQNEDGSILVCPTFFEDLNSPGNDTEATLEIEDLYSEEFINCEHTAIEKGCFEIHPNGSVYVPLYKRLFTKRNYVENEDGVIFVCPTFFNDTSYDKFPRAIYIVTLIGTVVSTLCVVVHIVMFLLLPKLRNLPGYCLFSMCIALMVAYICTFIPYARNDNADCTAVGVIKAYGFLASFFWMNVMAYDIWRSLRLATAKLRLSGQRPMMARFAMYSAYSWGCPLLIIIIGFIVNSSENSLMEYRLEITDDQCWFKYKQANLVYFASPLFTMIILNVLLFVSSFVMISSATMNTAENKADLWSRFLVSFRLAVVMGLMWIFGVLATATEAEWLWYFFVICNVLQGMFIFFSFTFTEKTRKEARKALTTKKNTLGEETGIFRCQTRYMRQKD
ncbi:hypothetical protein JTE90_016127 [Oedothorax gibbosus]|uniref:G-protein coupled receptors family 2 profile 2 domain-containing protein n=1 Tax=Oedothorax gibbosus TaxID=931172 RepID=A0AAV6U5I3_9ARAC|nr:hypothetical protein JTE90_016127 [Oedothorax gibbosus]